MKKTLSGARLALLALGLTLAGPALWSCSSETSAQKALREQRERYEAADEDTLRTYVARQQITDYRRTNSGLYVVNVANGQGTAVTSGKQVRVRYVGRFLTNGGNTNFPAGTVFDNSTDNRSLCGCAVFTAGSGAISGFSEGLLLMREGDRKRLLIPSGLAYGTTGQSNSAGALVIPYNAVLDFDVEVLSVAP